MNPIAETWRQLVRRRLWPVAVLLLAGLVAVPMVLAKEPAPVAPPPPPPVEETTAAEAAATGDPVVALAEQAGETRRRRVLGERKDPFAPAAVPKPEGGEDQPAVSDQQPAARADEPAADEPSGGAPSAGTPSAPAPVLPPAETPAEPKKKTYPPDSLIVRFGDATGDLERVTLAKLEPLPADTAGAADETEPVLVYTGLSKDGKSAVFMVDASAVATGDGECKPHPSNCETIRLRKGETEFFDVEDEEGNVVAQYQLDLVDIKNRSEPTATRARAARDRSAS
jgi:hypothetical protein